jgi:hypothetical protein
MKELPVFSFDQIDLVTATAPATTTIIVVTATAATTTATTVTITAAAATAAAITITATATEPTRTRAFFTRARLVDRHVAATEAGTIQSIDRGLSLGIVGHFHKSETARLTSELIFDYTD